MALQVETGAIIAGADSYVTEAEADTYHADRENTLWDTTSLDKSALLRKAAAYLDNHYYHRWKGAQVNPLTQTMQWPRAGVKIAQEEKYYDVPPSYYDTDYSGFLPITTIPQKVKDAQCELALRAASQILAADLERGGQIQSITVGPITKTFAQGAPSEKVYKTVDMILTQLLKPCSSKLVRG